MQTYHIHIPKRKGKCSSMKSEFKMNSTNSKHQVTGLKLQSSLGPEPSRSTAHPCLGSIVRSLKSAGSIKLSQKLSQWILALLHFYFKRKKQFTKIRPWEVPQNRSNPRWLPSTKSKLENCHRY